MKGGSDKCVALKVLLGLLEVTCNSEHLVEVSAGLFVLWHCQLWGFFQLFIEGDTSNSVTKSHFSGSCAAND